MDDLSNQQRAIELLQQLGLKEYESRTFVALSRLPSGTAKQISETSEVPRTRVYDAVRVLETKGLVEIQHSNPQQFRAVSIDEAIGTLSREYRSRTESLESVLQSLAPVEATGERQDPHEVWTLTGQSAIAERTESLVDEADSEVVIVIGRPQAFTDGLTDRLEAARRRGVDVFVGTLTEDLRREVSDQLPEATVFVSALDWLGQTPTEDDSEISRLLLVDRATILIGTFVSETAGKPRHERAVFGRGFGNGLVVIARRMITTGLPAVG